MKRWFTIAVLLLLIVILASAGYAWGSYQKFLASPLSLQDDGATVRVNSGDSITAMLSRLEKRGMTQRDWRWRVLLRLEPTTIQAGEYALQPGIRPEELLAILSSGDVIQYRFTILEGWSYRQLGAALLADERLSVPASKLDEAQVLEAIGAEPGHPEGWFLPETYAYTSSDDALDVLSRAHQAMRETLDAAWETRTDDLPLASPYELLTLASIVEKESSIGPEHARVAGVFVRRLQQNWRLETDPTVIYGMGDRYDGNIRRRDLREPTPYNTYVIRGLPPTPIAMPGAETLFATARPAQESAMFFVADGTGGHAFSTTLEEHNRAVQDYLRWYRAQNSASPESAEMNSNNDKTEDPGAQELPKS